MGSECAEFQGMLPLLLLLVWRPHFENHQLGPRLCLWLCCPFSAAQLQADAVTVTRGKRSRAGAGCWGCALGLGAGAARWGCALGLCAGAALPRAGGKLEATGHCLALLASRRHFRQPTLQTGQPFPMGAPAIPRNAWARGINGVIWSLTLLSGPGHVSVHVPQQINTLEKVIRSHYKIEIQQGG